MATIGYRSGPEWAERFGHRRANPDTAPNFCPDFLIETYLDRQVSIIIIMMYIQTLDISDFSG